MTYTETLKFFIWRIRFTYYMMRIAETGLSLGWYLSSVWDDEFMDWREYHPFDAVCEEVSYWDYDGE